MKVDRTLKSEGSKTSCRRRVDPFLVATQALESVDRLQRLLDQCKHSAAASCSGKAEPTMLDPLQ